MFTVSRRAGHASVAFTMEPGMDMSYVKAKV